MKKIKALIFSLLGMFCLNIYVNALTIKIPESINATEVSKETSVSGEENWWLDLLNIITRYFWTILVMASMAALLWGGYLLMVANGEPGELKKANHIIIYALVGILIAVFSYIIVKVVANFF